MNRTPHLLLLMVAALLAAACTLDGSAAPTPTFTLLATFPPQVVSTATEPPPVPVVATEVEQVAVTQAAVTQVAVANTAVPAVVTTCTAAPEGWLPYTVVAGDTLGVLAISTFSSVTELATANCITNADLIYVGQTLHLPRSPGAFLPTPIVGGVNLPEINNMLVEPSIVMSGVYTVTPGQVTVRAGSVSNATSVTFYTAPIGAQSTPIEIGTDTNPADGATVVWQVDSVPQQANVWAIATGAAGEQVTSEPILVQANVQ